MNEKELSKIRRHLGKSQGKVAQLLRIPSWAIQSIVPSQTPGMYHVFKSMTFPDHEMLGARDFIDLQEKGVAPRRIPPHLLI